MSYLNANLLVKEVQDMSLAPGQGKHVNDKEPNGFSICNLSRI